MDELLVFKVAMFAVGVLWILVGMVFCYNTYENFRERKEMFEAFVIKNVFVLFFIVIGVAILLLLYIFEHDYALNISFWVIYTVIVCLISILFYFFSIGVALISLRIKRCFKIKKIDRQLAKKLKENPLRIIK